MAFATKGVEGIGGHPELLPGAPQEWPRVGVIRVQQDLMRPQHIAGGLADGEGPAVHQQRLGVGGVNVDYREQHRFDLALHVVGLVDHVGDAPRARCGAWISAAFRGQDLVEDHEQLKRIDRADDQVVVRVAAVVKVEAAQPAFIEQAGHDVLDVGPLRVVP